VTSTAPPKVDAQAGERADRAQPQQARREGVVVITGASAGIGRATTCAFADAGYDVAVLGRGEAGLEGAVADVRARGRNGLAVPTDVARYDEVAAAGRRVEAELGPIDVWVNNAMTTTFAPAWEVDPQDFERAVQVTFLGQVWGTLVALDIMRPRDRGAIVDVGSALAFLGIPLQSAYCSSKFACRGFFESVRAELLHEGSHIRMSIVHMPAVNTTQFGWCKNAMSRRPRPVAPVYEPEVVAPYIVQAALDGRRSKVVGSWNRLVVAAGKVAPGLGNHYAALGAWDSQLTDEPEDHERAENLWRAADDGRDFGAHGRFGEEANGFWDASFLRSLPDAGTTVARAVKGLSAEKVRWLVRTDGRQRMRVAGSLAALAAATATRRARSPSGRPA
jgi:NAD(P)-dependent dehydrogenase (short-subunit alcohol dehydrogenase family)